MNSLGSGLLVAHAKPEDFLTDLVKDGSGQQTTLVFAAETCSEEREVEDKVEMALKNQGVSHFVDVWGNTLLHIDDLPQRIFDKFPTSATTFMR